MFTLQIENIRELCDGSILGSLVSKFLGDISLPYSEPSDYSQSVTNVKVVFDALREDKFDLWDTDSKFLCSNYRL